MTRTGATEQAPRLLDQVRHVLWLHHYAIHTECSYIDWIRRYVQFHHLRSREDLVDGERNIEAFLTDLAVRAPFTASLTNSTLLVQSNGVLSCPAGSSNLTVTVLGNAWVASGASFNVDGLAYTTASGP